MYHHFQKLDSVAFQVQNYKLLNYRGVARFSNLSMAFESESTMTKASTMCLLMCKWLKEINKRGAGVFAKLKVGHKPGRYVGKVNECMGIIWKDTCPAYGYNTSLHHQYSAMHNHNGLCPNTSCITCIQHVSMHFTQLMQAQHNCTKIGPVAVFYHAVYSSSHFILVIGRGVIQPVWNIPSPQLFWSKVLFLAVSWKRDMRNTFIPRLIFTNC